MDSLIAALEAQLKLNDLANSWAIQKAVPGVQVIAPTTKLSDQEARHIRLDIKAEYNESQEDPEDRLWQLAIKFLTKPRQEAMLYEYEQETPANIDLLFRAAVNDLEYQCGYAEFGFLGHTPKSLGGYTVVAEDMPIMLHHDPRFLWDEDEPMHSFVECCIVGLMEACVLIHCGKLLRDKQCISVGPEGKLILDVLTL